MLYQFYLTGYFKTNVTVIIIIHICQISVLSIVKNTFSTSIFLKNLVSKVIQV